MFNRGLEGIMTGKTAKTHDSDDDRHIILNRRSIGAFSVFPITPPSNGFRAHSNRHTTPVPGLLINSLDGDEIYIRGVRLISEFMNGLVGERMVSAGFIEDLMYFNGGSDDFSEFLYNLIIDDIGCSDFHLTVMQAPVRDPEQPFQTRNDWLSVVSISSSGGDTELLQ